MMGERVGEELRFLLQKLRFFFFFNWIFQYEMRFYVTFVFLCFFFFLAARALDLYVSYLLKKKITHIISCCARL